MGRQRSGRSCGCDEAVRERRGDVPGQTQFARTPLGARSTASARSAGVGPLRRDVRGGAGRATNELTEPIVTIEEPGFINGDRRTSRKTLGGWSPVRRPTFVGELAMPGSWLRSRPAFDGTSGRPYALPRRSARPRRSSASVTSNPTASQRSPHIPAVSCAEDSDREVATTRAPAWASATAMARPMPLPEPVTTATLPARCANRSLGGSPGLCISTTPRGRGPRTCRRRRWSLPP